MKYSSLILFVLLSFSLEAQDYAQHRLIVQLNDQAEKEVNTSNTRSRSTFGISAFDDLNTSLGLEYAKNIGPQKSERVFSLIFEETLDIENAIDQYQATGLFSIVEPDFIGEAGGKKGSVELTPNDNFFSRQYGLFNDGSFTLDDAKIDADIDMDDAWNIEQGSSDIVVCILDSGLRLGHPEFEGRLWKNTNEVINGLDDDNNGYVDDVDGWNFAYNNNDNSDDQGHGTNVAGIAVATGNNDIGYAGVDWNSQIMVGKILNANNSGFYSWWIESIYYAVDHGADVINMSVGGTGYSGAMDMASAYAHENNVVIVACMMNFNNGNPHYPAAYSTTIAVGSTDADDTRTEPFFWSSTSGSCYGNHIDLTAPGNFIYGLSNTSDFNYNSYWGGTSQSTPLVTGVASLLLAQDPFRTPEEIREILTASAEDQVGDNAQDTPGFDIYYGYGRLNALEALSQVTTNTTEVESSSALHLYPNPVQDILYFEGQKNASYLQIFAEDGRLVENLKVNSSISIDVSNYIVGLYTIKAVDSDQNVLSTSKFYKN